MRLFQGLSQYKALFHLDYAARLASQDFLAFIIEKASQKIEDESNSEKKYPLKYAYFSAHDLTLAGFMAAIQHPQYFIPDLASSLQVELFKQNGKLLMTWSLNDQRMNFTAQGVSCNAKLECDANHFLEYLDK